MTEQRNSAGGGAMSETRQTVTLEAEAYIEDLGPLEAGATIRANGKLCAVRGFAESIVSGKIIVVTDGGEYLARGNLV